ncbi:MAG: thioredoxin [Armatimonadetes bacterium]|nr:thioredoxin [Armatimonadota bacterium]
MSNALEVNESSFDTEVTNSHIPVLVDFWAGWCMPCKMLAPVVDQVAAEFVNKVKVVKVDVDSNQALAAKFGVRGIPTLLVLKNGQVVDRMVGVQPKTAIAAKLNDVVGA